MKILIKKLSTAIFLMIAMFGFFIPVVLASDCETIHTNFTGKCVLATENCPTNMQGVDTSSSTLCSENYKCCYKQAAASATDLKPTSTDDLRLQIPIFDFSQANNITEYLAVIYKYVMLILVPLTIIMIILGGIQWVLATGDSGKITSAKKQITQAFIGLFIALFSYILLSLVGITSLKLPGIEKSQPQETQTFFEIGE